MKHSYIRVAAWLPTNDPIPSLTTNATLTAQITLLLPLNTLQMIQFLSYGYCYSNYYGLLTLLLLLNAI
jgi:hypothetical protein